MAIGTLRALTDAQVSAQSIASFLTPDPQPMTCEGVVISDVEWFKLSQGPARRQGWFQITQIRQGDCWIPAQGQVWTRFPTMGSALSYGDRLRLHGSIRGPHPILENGEEKEGRRFNEGNWLWIHGASGILTITGSEAITGLDTVPSLWIRYRRWAASFRWQLKQLGRSLLDPLEVAYLEAFLLGNGQGIPRETWDAFKKSGTVHVLVVSGQHVSLIGYIAFVLLSIVRVPRTFRYLLASVILIIYCTLTGGNPPILRSTIMGILLCIGMMQGRPVSPLNSLGLAALLILAITPRALADVSFQLSFASVLGLFTLSPLFAKRLKVSREKETESPFQRWSKTVWQWIGRGLAVSCGAWMAVFPVIAWHFRMLTPIALAANLVIVPWASGVIVMGFLVYAVGWISPLAAAPFAASFSWLVFGLNHGVTRLADLPGAYWNW